MKYTVFYSSSITDGFPGGSAGKNPPEMQEIPVWFLGQEDSWRKDRLPTPVSMGFPGGSNGKESACNMGDLGSIPGLERSPRGGHDNPFQY